MPQHRDVPLHGRTDQRQRRRDPGQIVVDAHVPAHERETAVALRPGRHRLALVGADHLPGNAVAVEVCGKIPWPFARSMAEYGYGFHCSFGVLALEMRTILIGLALLLGALSAAAADITVIALTAGKATVIIDKAKPRTMAVGDTSPEGVKLIAATSESATFEVGGKRQTLTTGQHGMIAAGTSGGSGAGIVALTADSRGHFITTGAINGMSLRFMVATGASSVALSVDEAKRAGVNYLAGSRGRVSTANGTATVYMVKLDSLRIGDIELTNVDAVVI